MTKGNTTRNYGEYSNFYFHERATDGKLINGSYNRVWKLDKYVGTLSASNVLKIGEVNDSILTYRKLLDAESLRLMGFSHNDRYTLITGGVKPEHIQKQAGNSIVVDVIEEIYKELFLND